MKYLLFLLILAGGAYGAYKTGLYKRAPELLSRLKNRTPLSRSESIALETTPENTNASATSAPFQLGKVAGISTQAVDLASQFAKTANYFLSDNSATSDGTINVGVVAQQINKQVESIPSKVLQQAKVAYCTQVLIEATRSAEKK